jgi:uncharacterized protein YkwD
LNWRLLVVVAVLATLLLASAAFLRFDGGEGGGQVAFAVRDPSFVNGRAAVDFPDDYQVLAGHVLSQINEVRTQASLPPVSLSHVISGQQHADSMLYFAYFNHLDPQGLKPYTRYTYLNGTGYVAENIAWQRSPTAGFRTEKEVMSALDMLEFEMMYDDSPYGWDHRTNILDPHHNMVSIGIAYGASDVYLVEDFENSYLRLTAPVSLSGANLTFAGTIAADNIVSALVYYDPTPQPISLFELRVNATLQAGYTQGSFLGGALPPCAGACQTFPGHITQFSSYWSGGPG